ncbi:alpha/beta hydrolase fold domain-containing protein [Streptomyces sp. B6B3]|uniref:alpha/beta hydrolase n=1 Tax=Streptomyces sp. B6B3 TaxID=3153570 RepID=UPI00325C7024
MSGEQESAFAQPPVPPDATASYGDHPDQLVDLYRPGAGRAGRRPARPAPLVVLLHGGAWRAAHDRRHLSPLAGLLARRHGCAVASVEYRRGGGGALAGRWPDTLDDVAAATDAAPALAAEAFGEGVVDPGLTVLSGHSAGGHLVLWAAARHVLPSDSPWHRPTPPPWCGVVALAPIADLRAARDLGVCHDAVVQFLGGAEHVEARLPHTDPAALVPTGVATTIVQGATDSDVPPHVARCYAGAAARAGERPRLVLLPDVGHFALIDPSTAAAAVVTEEITRLT